MFSQRLSFLLECKDIRNKEFGIDLKLSPSTVSYYVSGKRSPNFEKLVEIAKYLDVSTDFLLGLTDVHEDEKDICVYSCLVTYMTDKQHEKTITMYATGDCYEDAEEKIRKAIENRSDIHNLSELIRITPGLTFWAITQ